LLSYVPSLGLMEATTERGELASHASRHASVSNRARRLGLFTLHE